eukprot:COSAG02_NODE_708_length_18231_cov_53.208416_4_plen_68_part_00
MYSGGGVHVRNRTPARCRLSYRKYRIPVSRSRCWSASPGRETQGDSSLLPRWRREYTAACRLWASVE